MDKNQTAVAVFNKHAEYYQQKYMDVSMYQDLLDTFCNSISKQGAEVLELASGPGNITQYILGKRPDLHVLATDLSPNMLQLAKANNPTADCQLLDARAVSSLNRTFDAIICGFCLPYLSKEEALRFIADAAKVLNKGGVLYLSTMEDNYNTSRLQRSAKGDEIYVYYHEVGYLQEAITKNGMQIILLRKQPYPLPTIDGTNITDLIIIAKN